MVEGMDCVASITRRISYAVASSKSLKYLTQHAFLFYLKSMFQPAENEVFDVTDHNYELLSKSFGLAVLLKTNLRVNGRIRIELRRRNRKLCLDIGLVCNTKERLMQGSAKLLQTRLTETNQEILSIMKMMIAMQTYSL